jgi:hypothetical protein
MEEATLILRMILYAAGIILLGVLVVVALRILRLLNDINKKLDDQVTPVLNKVNDLLGNVNSIVARVNRLTELISDVGNVVEHVMARINPAPTGKNVAGKAGQALAIWLAGLAKARAAARNAKANPEQPAKNP